MGKEKKQGQGQEVIQEPWGPVRGLATDVISRGQDWLDQGPNKAYEGQWVAGPSNLTQSTWDRVAGQVGGEMPSYIQAGNRDLEKTLSGEYLDPASNPYLADTMRMALQGVNAQVGSTFAGSGRSMSGAHARALAEQSADSATRLYGQNYANERGNMMQAQGLATGRYGAETGNQLAWLNAASKAGAQQDAFEQARLDAEREKYYYNQDALWEQISRGANLANTLNLGGRQYSPGAISERNKTAGFLGGAATGASAGAAFGPWGAVAGGVLGGIGGLL